MWTAENIREGKANEYNDKHVKISYRNVAKGDMEYMWKKGDPVDIIFRKFQCLDDDEW